MPSFFYWGRLPGVAEYNQHHWQYDVLFFLPYGIAAILLTVVCLFVAPKLSNRLVRRHRVTGYALASLVLILAVAAVSDMINIAWLRGGLFYGWGAASYVRLLIVGLPLAVSSALIASFIEKRQTRIQS